MNLFQRTQRLQCHFKVNPVTPTEPFCGFGMTMWWFVERLEAFFHPCFFLLTFHGGLWRVPNWVCSLASICLHMNEKLVKNTNHKICYFSVFWIVVASYSKSEIFLQKWHFFKSLSPLNKMKVIYSNFYPNLNLKFFIILNILLWFELWMHFQCLLHSNYRMTWKFSLHHDVCHCNIHTWQLEINSHGSIL